MKALYHRQDPDEEWHLDGVFVNEERLRIRIESILHRYLDQGYPGQAISIPARTRDMPQSLPAEFRVP